MNEIHASGTSQSFDHRCRSLVANLGLAAEKDILSITPLTGGVASDIGVVTLTERKICVKFALAKLKVAEDWRAPVHRNRSEYAWLEAAGRCVPDNVPKLFGWSPADNGFAMEFLEGESVYLWKKALLVGKPDSGEATAVADVLGQIHTASTAPNFDKSPFRNRNDFQALRLDPYLRFTASRHVGVGSEIERLADDLFASDTALIHGDVSPKNILFRDGKPIILDAECATMGDPAFDVSFCLNHLILKAVHLPVGARSLLKATMAFWNTYARKIVWEDPDGLEVRVAKLVPALMLARVDGKSPVEYLSHEERLTVRALALRMVENPPKSLSELVQTIERRVVAG